MSSEIVVGGIRHRLVDGNAVSEFEGFRYTRGTASLAAAADEFGPVGELGVEGFVGMVFRLMKRRLGVLDYAGFTVRPADSSQSAGRPVGLDELVLYGRAGSTLRRITAGEEPKGGPPGGGMLGYRANPEKPAL